MCRNLANQLLTILGALFAFSIIPQYISPFPCQTARAARPLGRSWRCAKAFVCSPKLYAGLQSDCPLSHAKRESSAAKQTLVNLGLTDRLLTKLTAPLKCRIANACYCEDLI